MKKYSPLDSSFLELPVETKKVLINNFEDLNKDHYNILHKLEVLDLPSGDNLNSPIPKLEIPDRTLLEIIKRHIRGGYHSPTISTGCGTVII